MNGHFDDMIRRRLEGHESPVSDGLFDAIQRQPEVQDALFDDAIRNKLGTAETAVPQGLFAALQNKVDLEHLAFDSTIHGKLENLVSQVPDNMWQRIVAEKDRRRRPIAWWWMAATALLILAGIGTAFLLKDNSKKTLPVAAEQTKTNKNSISPQQRGRETQPNTTAATTNLTIGEKDTSTNAQFNTISKQNTSNKTNGNKATLAGNSVLQSNGLTGFRKNASVNVPVGKMDVNGKLPTDNPAPLQYKSALETIEDADLATAQLSILGLLRNASRLTPPQLLKAKPHAPVIPCPINESEKRNDWYVEVYGSAFLLNKTILDNELNNNAKAGFDTTLRQQVSFNTGINVVKNLGEKFLLKTGLQYNRINESFRLTQVNERRLITTISVRTVIISPGDTVYIRDTSTTEQIGTAQHRTQNRYTQWDVPVIIGYAFGSDNLQLNANAGIIANIRSSYHGEMIADSTRQTFDINNYKGQPIYKKTVGFSLYTGLSILKPLSSRMSLLLEPHARIGLGNITNSQAWFNQKNSTMGLSIGLRYKFSGSRQRIY